MFLGTLKMNSIVQTLDAFTKEDGENYDVFSFFLKFILKFTIYYR